MSVPTFHAHFKTITHTSPMQYIKSTRLHHARLLMVRNDITAAEAARRVAYESPTQFSRESSDSSGYPLPRKLTGCAAALPYLRPLRVPGTCHHTEEKFNAAGARKSRRRRSE